MNKIVINTCHGGFGLSHAAMVRYAEIKGLPLYPESESGYGRLVTYWTVPPEERPNMETGWYRLTLEERIERTEEYARKTISQYDLLRDDPVLIQVVEEMGEEANGDYAALAVVEIPDDINWVLEEYDGAEWVAEVHRTWP